MRLELILHKTEKKGNKEEYKRKPPSIAAEERPYDLQTATSSKNIEKPTIDSSVPQNPIKIIKAVQKITLQAKKSREQSGNKPVTKWEQSGNKPVTKWEQSGNKPVTKWEQSGNKPNISNRDKSRNWEQSGNKSGNKPVTKWEQSGNKKKGVFPPISEVVGLQKSVLILIYQECKKSRSNTTPPLTLDHIALQLKTSTGSIKTTLNRLIDKGCITRGEFKIGRAGWTKYELSDAYYRDLLQLENETKIIVELEQSFSEKKQKPVTKWEQSGNKPVTEQVTNLLSSSSNYIKTTTTSDLDNLINDEWDKIDIDLLEKIGLQKYHVDQIKNHGGLTAAEVQESINVFAFDLETNDIGSKLKSTPINYFMGIMKKKTPYVAPANYEDPQTRSRRIYLERKKEEQKRKENLEKEIFLLAYKDWESTLTEEDISKIIPEPRYREIGSMFRQSNLEHHFRQTQWVMIQEEIKNKG